MNLNQTINELKTNQLNPQHYLHFIISSHWRCDKETNWIRPRDWFELCPPSTNRMGLNKFKTRQTRIIHVNNSNWECTLFSWKTRSRIVNAKSHGCVLNNLQVSRKKQVWTLQFKGNNFFSFKTLFFNPNIFVKYLCYITKFYP